MRRPGQRARRILASATSALAELHPAALPIHARVLWLRASLPRRLAQSELGALLAALTPTEAPRSAAHERRIFAVTERWLRRQRYTRTTCLYRALIRYVLLREEGLEVRFVMGIRADSAEIAGHAWLEHEDRVWMEQLEHAYIQTFAYPLPTRGI